MDIKTQQESKPESESESELIRSFKKYGHYALAFSELQNIILKMMIEGKETIDLVELDKLIVELKTKKNINTENNVEYKKYEFPGTGELSLKDAEKNLILKALYITYGNQLEASKLLGISHRSINYKIHTVHKINEFEWRKNKGVKDETK